MNKVILIGRLARDPELRTTSSGIAQTNFTVAVSRNFTNQAGEREADFIACTAWRKQAENVSKYCSKGSQVAVEGRIQVRSYDGTDGNKRYVTEVIADNVTFLGSKGSSNNMSFNESNDGNSDIVATDMPSDPYKDFGEEIALSDDDLPF